MRTLTSYEQEAVDGGVVVVAVVSLAVAVVGGMITFGYMAGKDMAARDDARAAE